MPDQPTPEECAATFENYLAVWASGPPGYACECVPPHQFKAAVRHLRAYAKLLAEKGAHHEVRE